MMMVRKKEFKKRALARFNFEINAGINMAVEMFALIKPAGIPPATNLDARTNTPLNVTTKWLCCETGTYLLPHQIKTYINYGISGRPELTKKDMIHIKDFGFNGIRLLGFKSLASLRRLHSLRSPYFLAPNERAIQGSSKCFHALLVKMHEMSKTAICSMSIAKRAPRMVALIPQLEELEEGYQVVPPGFHVTLLPYAEDIRTSISQLGKPLKIPKTISSSDKSNVAEKGSDQSDARLQHAKEMIHGLTLPDFDVIDFENPALQNHYANLQSLALDEPLKDDDNAHADTVNPDKEGMAEWADVIQKFSKSFGGDSIIAVTSMARKKRVSKKRKLVVKSSSKKVGKAKLQALTEKDFESLAKASSQNKNAFKNICVNQLKAFLKSKGLETSGKKANLVERIIVFFLL